MALAGAAGVLAGVVIGGASQSLPAASTHPFSGASTLSGPVRVTVTVPAPTPTVTVVHTATRTITVVVTSTMAAPAPLSSPIGVTATTPVSAPPTASRFSAAPGSPGARPSTPAASPSAPATSEPPVLGPGPTALCKDGTVSYTRQGGCAHHGGVAAGRR